MILVIQLKLLGMYVHSAMCTGLSKAMCTEAIGSLECTGEARCIGIPSDEEFSGFPPVLWLPLGIRFSSVINPNSVRAEYVSASSF